MARGWESKSVESQQEEALAEGSRERTSSPEEIDRRKKIETLQLTLAKLEADHQRSNHQRHREMLRRAMDDLNLQIRSLTENR